MRALFLDTSFILALEDADDQHHREAAGYWRTYHEQPQPLVSTAYVFDETLTLIRKRLDHARDGGRAASAHQSLDHPRPR